jgi:AcrR family transcriptional regulator
MSQQKRPPSARKEELLDRAYEYVLQHGLADMSLRPLAAAVGSSPRVLLFLFDSKDGLVRALLERARADELALLERVRTAAEPGDLVAAPGDLAAAVRATWQWLVAPAHRPLLVLWLEAYARSLADPAGPWAGFAEQTVSDWLAVLSATEDSTDPAARTLALAVLRGALLDLLATGDVERTTAAVLMITESFGRYDTRNSR